MKKITNEEFIVKAKKVHGNKYIYDRSIYKGYDEPINIECKIHGEFLQKPLYHLQGQGCKACGIIKSSESGKKTTKFFIRKSQSIHGDKYDYSKTKYTGAKNRLIIICPKNGHGEFLTAALNHTSGKGCPKCGHENRTDAKRITTKEFIKRAKKIHLNRYDYKEVEFISHNKKVKIRCQYHGVFKQIPAAHIQGKGCPKCALEVQQIGATIQELNEAKRDPDGSLYVLKVFDDEEEFYKIGITTMTLNRRFKNFPYDYEVLLFIPLGIIRAFQTEQAVIQNLKKNHYEPKKYFGGHGECFDINPINADEELKEISFWYSE